MKAKNNFIQEKIFYIIPLIFVIMASIRITYAYFDIKHQEESFAENEAKVLNEFFIINRDYYQNLFSNHTLNLNNKTLSALPAYSAPIISNTFSNKNKLEITIKTVSDRARNSNNIANKDELEAINHFKKNKFDTEYFSDKKEFYQYAYSLRIEPKCLKCHGKRSDAPKFIAENYDKAYDYKLGDIRGIVSIKIPKHNLKEYFLQDFIYSVFYDIGIFFLLFIFILFLLKKFKQINNFLRITIKEKTDSLSKQNSFLRSYTEALDQSSLISKTDPDGIITYVNKQFCMLTGYQEEELLGKTHAIIKHNQSQPVFYKELWDTILNKKIWTGVLKGLNKNNETFITQTTIVPVLNNKNEITEFIATRKDVTELINSKDDIKKSLITDRLTKLKNRYKLFEDIKKSRKDSFLCLLNIDGFKETNDFYGHKIADKLLVNLSKTINSLCASTYSEIYKLHADEFAILANGIEKNDFIIHINSVIETISKKEFTIEGNQIHITVSGGISFETENLFISADIALQYAKQKDKNLFTYNDDLSIIKDVEKNINSVKMLKQAIKNDSIIPYFQPIYNLTKSKIEKYECLARVVFEEKIYTPFHFLNIAKKSKLYPHITKSIISKSFRYFHDKEYEFSINISIIDVLNKNTVEFIKNKLSTFSNCQRIVFEILESEEIENFDVMKDFIKEIKKFGCKIAIDDFGSGYSNFSHILELDVDYLKIDSSLVKNITNNEDSKVIVQGIVDFSKRLNIKTIAEFVETKENLDLLNKLGVDYAQGYFIGKPKEEIL